MKERHIEFLVRFHKPTSRHLYTLRNGRVDLNGALNRKNYGNRRMGNNGICVWTDSIYSGSKTYKQTKRKRNSRRELQGRLMHQTNQFNHGGVDKEHSKKSTDH